MSRRPPPTPMLQAFVAAAKSGSFARAAVDLNLTASAVSHQIIKLEEWWRVKLFERHARGVTLSPQGTALFPVADAFFRDIDVALRCINPGQASPLKMTCTSSLCTSWLSPRIFIGGADIGLPEITLSASEVTKKNIGFHDFDLAIVIGDGNFSGYDAEFLMRDMVFPVCAPRLLNNGSGTDISEVLNHPIIHRADDQICPKWEDWFSYHDLDLPSDQKGPRFPDTSLTLQLAEKGNGFALGRTSLVIDQLCSGSLASLSSGAMPAASSYFVICKPDRLKEEEIIRTIGWLKHEANVFLDHVREIFPDLTYSE